MQEPLAEHLRDAGFEVQLLAAEPGRPNLVADLAGEADGETLCLLGPRRHGPRRRRRVDLQPVVG